MKPDHALNDCVKIIQRFLPDICPNNSGRNLKRQLESHPSFKDIFQVNSDPGVALPKWAEISDERMKLLRNWVDEVQRAAIIEAINLFTQYKNLKRRADTSRDERDGQNLHDVHVIGITATGLAKKCWFTPGDIAENSFV
jgi:hypothetical protein